jgi:hypothetical protein
VAIVGAEESPAWAHGDGGGGGHGGSVFRRGKGTRIAMCDLGRCYGS